MVDPLGIVASGVVYPLLGGIFAGASDSASESHLPAIAFIAFTWPLQIVIGLGYGLGRSLRRRR